MEDRQVPLLLTVLPIYVCMTLWRSCQVQNCTQCQSVVDRGCLVWSKNSKFFSFSSKFNVRKENNTISILCFEDFDYRIIGKYRYFCQDCVGGGRRPLSCSPTGKSLFPEVLIHTCICYNVCSIEMYDNSWILLFPVLDPEAIEKKAANRHQNGAARLPVEFLVSAVKSLLPAAS